MFNLSFWKNLIVILSFIVVFISLLFIFGSDCSFAMTTSEFWSNYSSFLDDSLLRPNEPFFIDISPNFNFSFVYGYLENLDIYNELRFSNWDIFSPYGIIDDSTLYFSPLDSNIYYYVNNYKYNIYYKGVVVDSSSLHLLVVPNSDVSYDYIDNFNSLGSFVNSSNGISFSRIGLHNNYSTFVDSVNTKNSSLVLFPLKNPFIQYLVNPNSSYTLNCDFILSADSNLASNNSIFNSGSVRLLLSNNKILYLTLNSRHELSEFLPNVFYSVSLDLNPAKSFTSFNSSFYSSTFNDSYSLSNPFYLFMYDESHSSPYWHGSVASFSFGVNDKLYYDFKPIYFQFYDFKSYGFYDSINKDFYLDPHFLLGSSYSAPVKAITFNSVDSSPNVSLDNNSAFSMYFNSIWGLFNNNLCPILNIPFSLLFLGVLVMGVVVILIRNFVRGA